jgi:hypothetical protein
MKKSIYLVILTVVLVAGTVTAGMQSDLDTAAKAGKVAFCLVYDQSALQIDQARQLIADAMTRVPGAVKVEIDRGDPANAGFVSKYGLSSAPIPLILVASSTGTITGGVIAQQGTVDQLVKMVPSPKKAEIIKALSEGNAVFVTAYRKSMKSVETVNSACAMACQQMAGKSVQVKVNMDDPAEVGFLTEMKVNVASTEPVTLVANAQGQVAGMYTGSMQVADLVTAATKKVGGCCPSTVTKPDASCGPAKK